MNYWRMLLKWQIILKKRCSTLRANVMNDLRTSSHQMWRSKATLSQHCSAILILLPLAVLLVMNITFEPLVFSDAKDYFFRHGSEETGAVNLVTSIYLGYRAFDTLGETIVLMLSITGVIFLMGKPS
ncbi:hypothetical protein U27_06643 [Candidatus Vecturithrix granuli]|uniref:MrpA C-terminal/MbhE domain-containing protein n=1 Tax=Vecturithrix granuli TaxID=1499967 RepID=A0A081C503_VECG1|nr:hypothetical protein U27_06643 [Candidatus Vecturithrix granuli]